MPAAGTRHRSAARSITDPVTPIWHPSPNFGIRRDGLCPELIVIHYTAMDSAGAALRRLCDADAQVSAHFLIAGDGQVWQMVDETMRAWHAGAGQWQGRGDVNSRSIGIELDNRGTHPFAQPQMAALEALVTRLMARWRIAPQGVIGHSDMAPQRKSDPGPRFDWRRLARQGLAVWPEARNSATHGPDTDSDFLSNAARFGYPVDDAAATLAAFRARFRPQASGRLCWADRALAADLARRFGVDGAAQST
ncbi:N-acetylmuramoyl-L-alanine amidase [Sedimentitalea sp. HM32M-2]|uniref:N-acetylmuramoyl-L-alanine amidase n=1 Tax=Sedimentitalea sp. HM32M-2 TaxID=3351566 RepID=UPI00362B8DC4